MKINKWLLIGIVLWVLWTAWVYATLNIYTTINNLYSYVKKLILTDDGTINGTQNIVLDGTNGRIDAKSVYVNGKEVATEEYVDTKASDTLTEAKAYADTKKTEAVDEAKSYTDNHVVDGAHIANGSITSDKIKNGEVKTVDIANGAITEDKLSNDLKSKIDTVGNQVVSVCNASNLGLPNKSWKICAYLNTSDFWSIRSDNCPCGVENRFGYYRYGFISIISVYNGLGYKSFYSTKIYHCKPCKGYYFR